MLIEGTGGAGSDRVGSTVGGIEAVIKINIYVTGLEADDCSKWRSIGGKASVVFVDVVAIGDRGIYGRGAWCRDIGCTRFRVAPRTLSGSSTITAFASKLGFYKGSNRLLHGFVVRRAERLEQDFIVAFESEGIRNHGIFDE